MPISTLGRAFVPVALLEARRVLRDLRRVGIGRRAALLATASPRSRASARVLSLPLLPSGFLPLDTAVDVGAYEGEVSESILRLLRPRRLVAFEPDPNASEAARERLARWRQAEVRRVALGAAPGTATLRRFAHPTNNSLLDMDPSRDPDVRDDPSRPEHLAPSVCEVRVERLDDALPAAEFPRIGFLKVDVQGGEHAVIEGGRGVLGRTDVLLIEVSFAPTYVGATSFPEVHREVEACGLTLHEMGNFLHGRRGSLIQADAVYVRPRR